MKKVTLLNWRRKKMPKNKTLDSTVKKSKVKSIGDFVKKYTAVAHIGDLHIMLSRVKFTKRQIKNYKHTLTSI